METILINLYHSKKEKEAHMKFWRIIMILSFVFYARAENLLDNAYIKYLKKNGLPPEEYIIEKLKTHNLVMLGEDHWIDAYPQFISQLIKKIVEDHAAQLDYVAMEFSSTAQQHLADKFIDSPEYREDLIIQILRDGPDFIGWGYQEVLDIFKTIWEVNKNHPERKPVRILLVNPPHRLIEGSNGLKTCDSEFQDLWNKNWAFFQDRDRFMAYQLEKSIIWKNLNCLFYCGAYHNTLAPIDSAYAVFKMGEKRVSPRGFPAASLLKILYPDKVFSIKLHGASTGKEYYPSSDPKDWNRIWNGRLDAIFKKFNNKPIGFDLVSPIFAINAIEFFGYWEDKDWAAFVLPYLKDLTIDRMFDGYIFLKPLDKYRGATIIPRYFDEAFFHEVQQRVKGQAEFPTRKDLYEFICKLRPVLKKPQNLENVLMK
jgi:hypothetical protein